MLRRNTVRLNTIFNFLNQEDQQKNEYKNLYESNDFINEYDQNQQYQKDNKIIELDSQRSQSSQKVVQSSDQDKFKRTDIRQNTQLDDSSSYSEFPVNYSQTQISSCKKKADKQTFNYGGKILSMEQYYQYLEKEYVDFQEDYDLTFYIFNKENLFKKEIDWIIKGICNISVFKNFEKQIKQSANLQKIIIEEIKFEVFPKQTTLFDFGEYGDKYYIVLKGQVDLYKPKVNVQLQNSDKKISFQNETHFQSANQHQNSHSVHLQNQNQPNLQQDQKNQIQFDSQIYQKIKLKMMLIYQKLEKQKEQKIKQELNLSLKKKKKTNKNLAEETQLRVQKHVNLIEDPAIQNQVFFGQENKQLGGQVMQVLGKDRVEQYQKITKFYEQILSFKPGQAFGEIALITKQKRQAAAVMVEETHFLTLNGFGYNQILGGQKKAMEDEKVHFMRQFSFFSNLPKQTLMGIAYDLVLEKANLDQVIFDQNQKCDYFYIIVTGTVEIFLVHKPQINKEENLDDPAITRYKITQKKTAQTSLIIVEDNHYFGDYEIVRGIETRVTRAVSKASEVTYYKIIKYKFLETLERYKNLLALIQESYQKISYLNQRLLQINKVKERQHQDDETFNQLELIKEKINSHHNHQNHLLQQTSFNQGNENNNNCTNTKFLQQSISIQPSSLVGNIAIQNNSYLPQIVTSPKGNILNSFQGVDKNILKQRNDQDKQDEIFRKLETLQQQSIAHMNKTQLQYLEFCQAVFKKQKQPKQNPNNINHYQGSGYFNYKSEIQYHKQKSKLKSMLGTSIQDARQPEESKKQTTNNSQQASNILKQNINGSIEKVVRNIRKQKSENFLFQTNKNTSYDSKLSSIINLKTDLNENDNSIINNIQINNIKSPFHSRHSSLQDDIKKQSSNNTFYKNFLNKISNNKARHQPTHINRTVSNKILSPDFKIFDNQQPLNEQICRTQAIKMFKSPIYSTLNKDNNNSIKQFSLLNQTQSPKKYILDSNNKSFLKQFKEDI